VARPYPKKLLVEGKDDVYAIASLMEHYVQWGRTESEWPLFIKDEGGTGKLLKDDVIPTYLKSSELQALGIVIDANEAFEGRWQRLRQLCDALFPDLPEVIPATGLVLSRSDGIRFGAWIMPDNHSHGMLETFLSFLVPDQAKDLWTYAQETAAEARKHGAPYDIKHQDKANMHTWLAWQDPPGRPFGEALKAKCLDPMSPRSRTFAEWMIGLFQLDDRRLHQS